MSLGSLFKMVKEFEETGKVDLKPKIPKKKGDIKVIKIKVE